MAGVWRPTFGLTMRQLQPHRFLIRFYNELDIDRVLAGGPWTFGQCLLVMQRLEPGVDPELVVLQQAEFWVQIHSLPVGFRSEVVVSVIGSFLGTMICIDEKNWDGSMRLFYRVRVAIDVSRPLKKHMKLKKDNGTWAFIDFCYERLPKFCFMCGVIGHGDQYCPKITNVLDRKAEKPFGAWLGVGGRRSMPSSGQRWVAPESNTEREGWKSPAMEVGVDVTPAENGEKGKQPLVLSTALVSHSDAHHSQIPAVVLSEQKRKRIDEGAVE
ncbi:uncharacterized protein LOC116013142 [Ipomoea triloba]|uniref:uncharacterized protein LOC116013142 n=1 Tax=Ipomoea triloba TaxID=35885 RepID=UPI00125D25C5|nr:uncharacterized protein LOC116013142 [Ipomoea triloba]